LTLLLLVDDMRD